MSEPVVCTCGEEFDTGDELADHIRDAEGDDHAPGTTGGNVPDKTMKDEISSILPGRDPLKNLDVTRIRFNEYSVMSARNGSVTRHEVSLSEPSCTCEDWQYNKDDNEVCAHFAAAQLESDGVNTKGIAMNDLAGALSEAYEAKRTIESAEESIEEALCVARDTEAHAKQQATDAASEASEQNSQTGGDSSAQAAAERLQEAYDDVINDMQVQDHAGYVWVQTGQDTPDTLPGPGNVEVFEAFLQNPGSVQFVHDDHELASERPGEWWKNAIEPSDVEEYISEVLE